MENLSLIVKIISIARNELKDHYIEGLRLVHDPTEFVIASTSLETMLRIPSLLVDTSKLVVVSDSLSDS